MSRQREGEAQRGLIAYLNEERPDALLLLAWNYFGRKNALKCVITDADEAGFLLDISYGKNKTEESVSYTFPEGPLKDAAKLKLAVGKLLARHSGATWPAGVAPFVVILMWLGMLIGGASKEDLLKYPILSILQPYTHVIFRQSIYAQYAVFAMISAHTLEGLYVGYLCNILSMPKSSGISWVGLTFFLGYPTTSQVVLLAHIGRKKKLRYN